MSLPMSLRTAASEQAYQDAKASGATKPLELEPALKIFEHWRIINNGFPYDVGFAKHHLLVPKRASVAQRWDLNDEERKEFEILLRDYIYDEYDLWFENCPKRRSVAGYYHIHLASYVEHRDQMSL